MLLPIQSFTTSGVFLSKSVTGGLPPPERPPITLCVPSGQALVLGFGLAAKLPIIRQQPLIKKIMESRNCVSVEHYHVWILILFEPGIANRAIRDIDIKAKYQRDEEKKTTVKDRY